MHGNTHTSQMNHPPKRLASSAFPEPAMTAEHYCMTWESQGSNEMHTLSTTSSSRHNSEQQLKSKLKWHWTVSAIVLLSPVNKPALWHIVNQGPFALFCSHAWLPPQTGSPPAPTVCLCRLPPGRHGMHLQHAPLTHISETRSLPQPAVCVLLLHGG